MSHPFKVKDPSSIEPIGFNWEPRLGDFGSSAVIDVSEWSVSGPSPLLELDEDQIVTGSMQTQVLLIGGVVGEEYKVVNHITASTGAEDERTYYVSVQNR